MRKAPAWRKGQWGCSCPGWAKLPGFAVRLALIFAHLAWCEEGKGDPPGEVGETDMLRALTLFSDYAIPMPRRCFGEAALPQAERDGTKDAPLGAATKTSA